MYLSTLRLSNFRSCYQTTELQLTLTLLVGENNSGKSNVIEALRLATVPLNLRRTRYFEADDLSHGQEGVLLDVPACLEEGVTVGAVRFLDLGELEPRPGLRQELLCYSLASPS